MKIYFRKNIIQKLYGTNYEDVKKIVSSICNLNLNIKAEETVYNTFYYLLYYNFWSQEFKKDNQSTEALRKLEIYIK